MIDDSVADKIVDLFKTSMQPKAGSKYFLVRETVRAGAVSYKLKQADRQARRQGRGREGGARTSQHHRQGQ